MTLKTGDMIAIVLILLGFQLGQDLGAKIFNSEQGCACADTVHLPADTALVNAVLDVGEELVLLRQQYQCYEKPPSLRIRDK